MDFAINMFKLCYWSLDLLNKKNEILLNCSIKKEKCQLHTKLSINLITRYEWALLYVTPVNYEISVHIFGQCGLPHNAQ